LTGDAAGVRNINFDLGNDAGDVNFDVGDDVGGRTCLF
jgi:hypothetical protein